MQNQNMPTVLSKEGVRGRLLSNSSEEDIRQRSALVELENGQHLQVPANMLVPQPDGTYYLPLGKAELEEAQRRGTEHSGRSEAAKQETALVVPVVQEEVVVEKRRVETGRARITKHVHEHEVVVDEPLLRQDVAIEHVPINKIWDGPPPPSRYEGDKLIISLLEEVLVIEKRLMLKEELHISRVEKTVHEPQTVIRRSEEVTVERVEPSSEAQVNGSTGS